MTDASIVTQLPLWTFPFLPRQSREKSTDLHTLWQFPDRLSACITDSPTIRRCVDLLGPLDWAHFPERNLQRNWGRVAMPFAALAAAELIRLNEGIHSMGRLYTFLLEDPGFIPLLGFPLQLDPGSRLGFNALASLPTERHLTYLLRRMPNRALQFLLADSVKLILTELAAQRVPSVDCVSLDTKHFLAWVQENNPKAYVKDRYDKTRQPKGDPDCRLGCNRRHNRVAPSATLTRNPVSPSTCRVGEYYWGYGSGVVVAKVPDWGEFVIAELTQPFDAWYVYAHFYRENDPDSGFAAVPFVHKGRGQTDPHKFAPDGTPLCAASLPMPLRFTFIDRITCLVEHERGKYVCPLQFPTRAQRACPVHHRNSQSGGCTVMMPTSMGARIRCTLDRHSDLYKQVYRQRTAVERINSQTVALGIERPHLRNGAAIANKNTLIYLLINLRFLQRLRQRLREAD